MFKNLLLSFFPEETNSRFSPIKFHINLISAKSFYGLNIKYWSENRKLIGIDSMFSFFDAANTIKFDSINDENFYYEYKNFAFLNAYDNINIYTILPAVSLITIRYYAWKKIWKYLDSLLFWINYLLIFFLIRLKEYSWNDKENLDFMLSFLKELIFNFEKDKKANQDIEKVNNNVENIMKLLEQNTSFLIFLYKLTNKLSSVFAEKKFTDIIFYENLFFANLFNFPEDTKKLIKNKAKEIYLKRYSVYIDLDIITLSKYAVWDLSHLTYLLNKNNLDFLLNYFVDSLSYIDDISLEEDVFYVVTEVLNEKKWGILLINSLKDYNSDNLDFDIDPSVWLEKLQEMMSKEMMDSVKKLSFVNETFLDFYISVISRKYNALSDTYQFKLLYNTNFVWKCELNKEYYDIYKVLDMNYFSNSYYYSFRKNVEKYNDFFDTIKRVLPYSIYDQSLKIVFSDFQKKTKKHYIKSSKYLNMLKKYFYQDLKVLIKKDIQKNYIKKYFKYISFEPNNEQIINFRENIYYPDFIVFYKFLKVLNYKLKKNDLIIVSRIKESLFGYLIFRSINGYSKKYEKLYSLWVWLIAEITIDFEKFYQYFIENYPDFIDYFFNIKQNKKFVNILTSAIDQNLDLLKPFYFYDNMKAISLYNKRVFKI